MDDYITGSVCERRPRCTFFAPLLRGSIDERGADGSNARAMSATVKTMRNLMYCTVQSVNTAL